MGEKRTIFRGKKLHLLITWLLTLSKCWNEKLVSKDDDFAATSSLCWSASRHQPMDA